MKLPSSTAVAAFALLACSAASAQPAPASAPAPAASGTEAAPSPAPAASASVDADGVRHVMVTNGPVADTPENRAKYGKPMSHAGRHTAPAGN